MRWIVLGLLFLLPLVVFPYKNAWFENSKVIIAQLLIQLLLIVSLIKNHKPKKIASLHLIPILFIFVISVIHLFPQANISALYGNIFRLQGTLLIWHLLIFSLFSSFELKIPKFLPIFSLTGLFLSSFLLGTNAALRTVGSLGEPNALASTAVFLMTVIFFYNKLLSLRIMAIIMTGWIIFVTKSDSAILALTIEAIFLLSFKLFRLSAQKALIACLILIAASYSLPFFIGGGWYENRQEVWQTGLIAGAFSPIWGYGFGNIEQSIHKTGLILNNNIQYQRVDSAHNFLLDFWIEGGIVGVISILILIYLTFQNFVTHKKRLEITAFLGLLTVMSFNPVSVVSLLAFWWLIGQGVEFRKKV